MIVRERAATESDERAEITTAGKLAAMKHPDAVAAAIHVYASWDRMDEALALLPELNGATPDGLVSVARMLRRRGFLIAARDLLAQAKGGEAAALQERIDASVRVFNGWRPRISPKPVASTSRRVLHLAELSLPYALTGYTVRTHLTAKAQRAIGIDAHVLTKLGFPPRRRSSGGLELHDGVPYHRLPYDGADHLASDLRLELNAERASESVTELRPRVLHPATDFQNALLALVLREATGVPVVYEVRGFWEDTWLSREHGLAAATDYYRMRQDINTKCMREADHVVTLSETMKQTIVARGVETGKVSVVPNGVDFDRIYPVAREPRIASELGIAPDDIVVGYIGTLNSYEGLDLLVEAVAHVGKVAPRLRCLIVGDGRDRRRLAALTEELGVADRVILTGSVNHDQVLSYYGVLDIFAMPRRDQLVCNRVTPLKPYEAMATRTTLVVSNVDALQELVIDGQTGVVTPADDSVALAAALERLVGDATLRDSLAGAAYDWVRRERSWERTAVAYKSIYEQLALR